MSLALEQLLLKVSKGTIVEGLAKDAVRQKFQNDSETTKLESIVNSIGMIILLLIIIYVMIFVIPIYIHQYFVSMAEDGKSLTIIVYSLEMMAFFVYFSVVGYLIISLLLLMLVITINLIV